jgi:GrpB-like predicted nucleotidyltransferase (UPF0157 family)
MSETLTEMFDRITDSIKWNGMPPKADTSLRARLKDAKVANLDASTDVEVFIRDDVNHVKRRMFDYKLATGGIINDVEFIRADGSRAHGTLYLL